MFFKSKRKRTKHTKPQLTTRQRMMVRFRNVRPLGAFQGLTILAVLSALLVSNPTSWISSAFAAHVKDDGVEDETVTIDFVGDVMLGRYIGEYGEAYGYDTIFDGVTSLWDEADLVFANLESAFTLSDEEYTEADKDIHLSATYESLAAALEAGVDVVACANNHSYDYGATAVEELVAYLEANDVPYSGIGEDADAAQQITYIEENGITIGFLSVTEVYYSEAIATDEQAGVLTTDAAVYQELVFEASQNADLVIVYMHWGEENETSVNEEQETLGHQLIDAGADIIIGSHPHVLQEVELYKDGIIFYSLGNFIFDQGNTYSCDSVVVELTIEEDGEMSFTLHPVRIVDGCPVLVSSGFYASRIANKMCALLDDDDYTTNDDGTMTIDFRSL